MEKKIAPKSTPTIIVQQYTPSSYTIMLNEKRKKKRVAFSAPSDGTGFSLNVLRRKSKAHVVRFHRGHGKPTNVRATPGRVSSPA